MKYPPTHASEIEARAAQWLARRDAAGEDADSPEFTAWLASDRRHRAAYLRIAAAWDRSARLKRLRTEGDAIDADLLKPRRQVRLFSWPSWRPIFAATAGVAVIALALSWWILSGRQQTYSTGIGGLSRVVLKDGSTVTLNTDSELRVRFSRTTRLVELLKGEAQFSVAHDRRHPFEVLANGRLVRAVGTAFDVKLGRGQSVDVLVTEGRVAVLEAPGASQSIAATAGPPETVSAGESAVATQNGTTVRPVSAEEVSRYLAWQVGELSFQGETLSQAVAEFNRYNRRKLKIQDPSISNLQIGGNFQALDIDSFAAALERSFGITVTHTDRGNVILTGRTGDSPSPTRH